MNGQKRPYKERQSLSTGKRANFMVRAWKMSENGLSVAEIAKELSLAEHYVKNLLHAMRGRALAKSEKELRSALSRELGELKRQRKLAYRAFEESRGDIVTTEEEDDGTTITTKTKTVRSSGNVDFLKEATEATKAIIALLGLHKIPKTNEVIEDRKAEQAVGVSVVIQNIINDEKTVDSSLRQLERIANAGALCDSGQPGALEAGQASHANDAGGV